jgi:hypothetical protein
MATGMTRHRSTCWVLLVTLLFGLSPLVGTRPARAETPQETALARSLFEEGVTLADQSDWAGAADRFGRAYAIKPTSGIAFNYASALIELGKLVEASELLRKVKSDPNASEELRRQGEAKLQQIQPRIAYLTVELENDPGTGRVELGNSEWPRAALGVASPVDPGTYTVRCVVGGVEQASQEFTIAEGERRALTLSLSAPQPPKPQVTSQVVLDPNADLSHRDETPEGRRPLYKNWMLWAGVGAVVAGGVVAAVLLSGRSKTTQEEPVMGNTGPGVLRW